MEAISLEGKGLLAKNMGFRVVTHTTVGENGNHLTGVNVLTHLQCLFFTQANSKMCFLSHCYFPRSAYMNSILSNNMALGMASVGLYFI